MNKDKKPIVLSVSGGKGGVGKTQVSVNIAIGLSRKGYRVLLLDADLGLANINVVLGLQTKSTLEQVVSGLSSLSDIVLEGPYGVKVIPGASGVRAMTRLSALDHASFIHAFDIFYKEIDYLIIDTAAGIHESVLQYLIASDHVLLVACNEPGSIADTYALMKVLTKDCAIERFHLIANRVQTHQEGNELFAKINKVATQFLSAALHPLGVLPEDPVVSRALQQRKSVIEVFPGSSIAKAYLKMVDSIEHKMKARSSSGISFFFEQSLKAWQE